MTKCIGIRYHTCINSSPFLPLSDDPNDLAVINHCSLFNSSLSYLYLIRKEILFRDRKESKQLLGEFGKGGTENIWINFRWGLSGINQPMLILGLEQWCWSRRQMCHLSSGTWGELQHWTQGRTVWQQLYR